MARNPQFFILYQAMISFCMLSLVSTAMALAWALLYLREGKARRYPGIDLKEFRQKGSVR